VTARHTTASLHSVVPGGTIRSLAAPRPHAAPPLRTSGRPDADRYGCAGAGWVAGSVVKEVWDMTTAARPSTPTPHLERQGPWRPRHPRSEQRRADQRWLRQQDRRHDPARHPAARQRQPHQPHP
jgi:hypothetical protein